MKKLYPMIFKRKSVRAFHKDLHISQEDINLIRDYIVNLKPLVDGIRVETRIVPVGSTTCRIGEYCILIYSEQKENWLQNVGYMFEQLDLYLASINIGTCWYGLGKTSEKAEEDGLKYAIMLAIGKSKEEDFRKDFSGVSRMSAEELWAGEPIEDMAEIIRFAPSACNSQPWRVEHSGNKLTVLRANKLQSKIPKALLAYFNNIDLGIFLCFVDVVLSKFGIPFVKEVKTKADEPVIAEYTLN